MDTLNDIITWAWVAVAVTAVVTLGWTGQLGERALSRGPTRDIDLPAPLRLLGIAIMLGYVALMVGKGLLPHDNNPDTTDSAYDAASVVAALLPLAVIGLMIGRAANAEAGFRKIGLVPRHPLRDLGWAGIGVPVAYALASAVFTLVAYLSWLIGRPADDTPHDSLQMLMDNPSAEVIATVIVGAVILAPLQEELTFRGVLQTCLMQQLGQRRWPALLITAALFSVTHCWVVPWHALPSLFALGLVFGYVYERTGSLLGPLLIHAGFNAVNIGLALASVH